jgi:hypothetical protein
MAKAKGRCEQCQVVRINGMRCHEIGCPIAWREEVRECKECGQEFSPEQPQQDCCSDDCAAAYGGWDWPGEQERDSDYAD